VTQLLQSIQYDKWREDSVVSTSKWCIISKREISIFTRQKFNSKPAYAIL